jgi:hypothetical protein
MKNHKWDNDQCTKCGCRRLKKTFKIHMAIVGNKDHFLYQTGYIYWFGDTPATPNRPECIKP